MLNVWQSMPSSGPVTGSQLKLVSPSTTDKTFFSSLSISRPANMGLYPISFTLWHTGNYITRITSGGVDITGSPTTTTVSNAPVDPTSSLANGVGLVGGIAGEPLTVRIQAKDTRKPEVQTVMTYAYLTNYTQEVQKIDFASQTGAVLFSYELTQATSTIVIGQSLFSNLKSSLESIPKISKVTLLDASNNNITLSDTIQTNSVVKVRFDNLYGDLSVLQSNHSSVAITQETNGESALWGSFSLGYKGENTSQISVSASASQMKSALEALYSIGQVSVTKDSYGLPANFQASQHSADFSGVFSIWTITFSGTCVSESTCPTSLGDEPLLYQNIDNIDYLQSSSVYNQKAQVFVSESAKGYPGNNRLNDKDLESISIRLTKRNSVSPITPTIGMNEIHRLTCSGNVGIFTIQFLNYTISIDASITVHDFKTKLQLEFKNFMTISTTNNSTYICSSSLSSNMTTDIIYHKPWGSALPLPIVINNDNPKNLNVKFQTVEDGIDYIKVISNTTGLYEIMYTPTVKGVYDILIRINSINIATEFTKGIYVLPAPEYAGSSTHNISQVNVEAITQYFTIQFRDRFGNTIDGPIMDDSIIVTQMKGVCDLCRSDADNDTVSVEIPIQFMQREPYTDGIYSFSYDPTAAGSYTFDVKLLTRGGLLATYFKTTNYSVPVLASASNFHDNIFHDPYWCDGLLQGNFSSDWTFGPVRFCDLTIGTCGCDSTRLDTALDFDWKDLTPLPYDGLFTGKFPNDFYSVEWVGYLKSPGNGVYTFNITSDYGVYLSINGTVLVNQIPMKSRSIVFQLKLNSNEYNEITIRYIHQRDDAYFRLSWSGPELNGGQIISQDSLYYSRNIIQSPLTVHVYPGVVNNDTSSAVGSGLNECVALKECSFVIQARDVFGNNIFNAGNVDWNISIPGIGDWAGYNSPLLHRINDVNYTDVAHVIPTQTKLGWENIGTASVSYLASFITTNSDFTAKVRRGDSIKVGEEIMMISTDSTLEFSSQKVPLSRPYLGNDLSPFDVYKITNCTTGKYRITYTPKIRGRYNINILTKSVNEVQFFEIYADQNLNGVFKLTPSVVVDGYMTLLETAGINLTNSISSSIIETALENLDNLGDVSVSDLVFDPSKCTFKVTFFGLDQDIPLTIIGASGITGNNVMTRVTEYTKGSPASNIIDSPFALDVLPGPTDASFSTSAGKGLIYGETGVTSEITVQSKDSWGNNRRHIQPKDVYRLHTFIANRNFYDKNVSVAGLVDYYNPDEPVGWMDSVGDGCDVYAALPDARLGLCYSGEDCGCGSAENHELIGPNSFGMYADQVCCACRDDCGGLYRGVYIPTQSGVYTVVVMMANKLEVQNLTVTWSNLASRTGYFSLSYGVCSVRAACIKTKNLAWDVNGPELKEAIESLPGVGEVDVTYSVASDKLSASWTITFLTACDLDDLILYASSIPTMSINTIHQGTCSHVGATTNSTASIGTPFVNQLLVEEKQTIGISYTGASCSFKLNFRGAETSSLSEASTQSEIKLALESLDSIGTVNVVKSTSASGPYNITLEVEFKPTAGYTLAHLENYGDLPPIQVTSVSPSISTLPIVTQQNGFSPYVADVEALKINSIFTTAVHQNGVPGKQGLTTGIYLDTSSFTIESRDSFTNRVFVGPVNEVQIIETYTNSSYSTTNVSGSFTISYFGHSVELDAQAGIAVVKAALESLPSIGAVKVTTNSVKLPTGLYGNITSGSSIITDISSDPANIFIVGDWIRLHSLTGPVFTIVAIDSTKKSISLSSAVKLSSVINAPLFNHARNGYQYIIEFDSNHGDLNDLQVLSSLIDSNNNPAYVQLIACNGLEEQTIETRAGNFKKIYE